MFCYGDQAVIVYSGSPQKLAGRFIDCERGFCTACWEKSVRVKKQAWGNGWKILRRKGKETTFSNALGKLHPIFSVEKFAFFAILHLARNYSKILPSHCFDDAEGKNSVDFYPSSIRERYKMD